MKKLSVNIEDIHIKGGPLQLTELITSMDNSLQKIAQDTEDATGVIIKYSASNKGVQYQKAASTLSSLNARLYEASLELNNMQNEIVKFQNKVLCYEGQSELAGVSNKIVINKANLDVASSDVQFALSEMIEVKNCLSNYSGNVFYGMQEIVRKKNDVGSIWLDSQYKDFAEFIDGLNMDILNSLRVFGEYIGYLDEKIKELSH